MEVIRGHILIANNRMAEAERVFKQAILNAENTPKIMLRIMVSLYDNHYVNASYHLFKKFFKYVDEDWNEGYAYMALCCWDLNKDEEFMSYLEQAIKKNPKETRMVLGGIFPKNLPIEDYYEYMHNQLNKDRS